MSILTLNAGSSSIRFAFYEQDVPTLDGKVERIGLDNTTLTARERAAASGAEIRRPLEVSDHQSAAGLLLDWLAARHEFKDVTAVGHRVVHGMKHTNPERVTPELVQELKRITPYDPEHLPREIELIETVARKFPNLAQVACFDTAFHRTMPRVATILPIPRRYADKGVERYGFHGLSYTYLMRELARLGDPAAAHGRIVLAHLGNGASIAAVRDGKSIDTSMGFTPTAGLVMSTRSGDLDPGVMGFLALTESMDAAALQKMVNHESGLLGVSEKSSDIRDLLACESADVRAAEAVALFCYQAKKWLAALAGALGGVDTLVFAGGIGENAPTIRGRICDGLDFLGIQLDANANGRSEPLISSGTVCVRVIRTNEESVIADLTAATLRAAT